MKDTALPNVAVILLILIWTSAAACSQTELTEPADSSGPTVAPSETAQPQLPAGARPEGAKRTGGDRDAPVIFPRHNAPLGTDRSEQYTAGKLILEEGCLRVEVPAKGVNSRMSRLVIWPSSFTFKEESGSIRIIDGLGRTAAQVGDHIRLSRAAATYQQARDQEFSAEGIEHCEKPSFWVGDEVTVFDRENEATEMRLSDPYVLLLRQNTEMAFERAFMTAAGVGELVLDGQCLRLKGEYHTSTQSNLI